MNEIQSSASISSTQTGFGGKAEGLLFLKQNGFNVPPFYLLDYETLQKVELGDLSIAGLLEAWQLKYQIAPDTLWAVRSSAHAEDGEKESFAGLFTTEINVSPSGLGHAIETVLAAYSKIHALPYGSNESHEFGIIIQKMIRPKYSGVSFSHNPLDLTDQTVFINLIPGLGIHLVSGKEHAFAIKSSKEDIEYLNESDTFKGQIYDKGLQDVVYTGIAIKKEVAVYIDELLKTTRQLSGLKNQPVDIEFSIAENQIYWLQVRPITGKTTEAHAVIWDNSNIGENYPGLTLPLSISFVQYTYKKAYSGMAAFLGMPKANLEKNTMLFGNMVGGINGALYYNVTAWQQLLYQLPFGNKTSRLYTQTLGMDAAPFSKPATRSSFVTYLRLLWNLLYTVLFFRGIKNKFEAIYNDMLLQHKQLTESGVTHQKHAELIKRYLDIEAKLMANWIAPVLNGFFAMLFFSALKRLLQKSVLLEEHPNFANDILFSQGDVISVKIVREFQELLQKIAADDALGKLFQAQSAAYIAERLPELNPEFSKSVQDYIENYGERCEGGELKLETINYKDDPIRFISLLKTNATGIAPRNSTLQQFDYRKILQKQYRYRPLKRILFLKLIELSINRIRDRENYRFMRTKAIAICRSIFREMDDDLMDRKLIEQAGDSLYLNLSDMLDLHREPMYKAIIDQNKLDYARYETVKRANRYIETPKGYSPVERDAADFAKTVLKGIGCCSGTITAPVRIIDEVSIQQTDLSGCILVASYFEPGWINLFAQASGVISEKGNLLSHTAILCREMGIPAIVGAKGIMSVLKNGDQIQMNGASGAINILYCD